MGEAVALNEGCSVVQHALGGIVEVVVLPRANGVDEEAGEDTAQHESHRQQKENRPHASALLTAISTRDAPQITNALESGIRIAATSGLTHPAAAAVTARAL